ncbi:MAG: stage V sporulation protein AD [Oscillospiraceae bacterium]|nr:stage V sporulation protein AD [Oscillospiraceae bacterium]
MAKRVGQKTLVFEHAPQIVSFASVGGKMEGEGPLANGFTILTEDDKLGQDSWEKAESCLQASAISHALKSARLQAEQINLHLGGDLLNQCIATNFAMRNYPIPLTGLYGACSTFALALGMGALAVDAGGFDYISTAASSHFCSAEKQFRFPLEYGGQPTPTAQRTATAAGAVILAPNETPETQGICVSAAVFGHVLDYGVSDPNEMGAAMAPAAFDTIAQFLRDTQTAPQDYDLILTGDLGAIGSRLLLELANRDNLVLRDVHRDCGLLLYDIQKQDAGAGGSGIGCSAAVLCASILPQMRDGKLKRVLFVGTGALLSAITPLQGENIPAIAHAALLENRTHQ